MNQFDIGKPETSQIPMRERLRLRSSKVFFTSMVFVKLLFRTRLTPVSFAYSRVVSSELLREHLRCELWRRQVLPSCWHLPSPSLPSSTLASKLSPLPKVPIVHLASPLAPTHLHGCHHTTLKVKVCSFFMYVNWDPFIIAVLYNLFGVLSMQHIFL